MHDSRVFILSSANIPLGLPVNKMTWTVATASQHISFTTINIGRDTAGLTSGSALSEDAGKDLSISDN